MGPLVVFDTHMQWLKPMQKAGFGGDGLQFSLQTRGIDEIAPPPTHRFGSSKVPCLKDQQDAQKRRKRHPRTTQPILTSTNPLIQLIKVFFF